MKKNTKQKIQKKFSRQHLVMTLVLAVALTLGAWLALVMPSELAAANEDAGHMHTFACYEGFELACDDETHAHTFDCWQYSGELVCGLEEGAAHVHGDGWICEPVATVLICDLPEHTHNDDCLTPPVVQPQPGQPEDLPQQPDNNTQVPGQSEDDAEPEDTTPPVDENQTEGTTPPADENQTDGTTPPADENQTEGTTPPADENQTEGTTPPADENQTEGTTPPADENQTEGTTPPADENQTEGDNSGDDVDQTEGDNSNGDESENTTTNGDQPTSGSENQTGGDVAGDLDQSTGNVDENSSTEGENPEDNDAHNDVSQNTESTQDDVAQNGADGPTGDAVSSSGEAGDEIDPVSGGGSSFNVFHTVLADTYPPLNDYPPTYCEQTAHEHSEECYMVVYMCRQEPVAQIGDKTFTDLQAAVDAAENNSEIVLLKDFAVEKTVNISGKTLTINLNGQTVTYNGLKDTVLFDVANSANFTITGAGKLYSSANGIEALVKVQNAVFNLQDGVLTNENGYRAINAFAGSKVYMTGGELSGVKNGSAGAGVLVLGDGSFEMTGGVIENNNSTNYGGAIRILAGGNVHIGGEARIVNNTAQKGHGGDDVCYSICTNDSQFTFDKDSNCYIEGIKDYNADTKYLQELVKSDNPVLDRDLTVLGNITVDKKTTLDLDGHKIVYAGSSKQLFTVGKGIEFTILGNGELSSTVNNLEAFVFVDGGTLNLQGGTFTNTNGIRAITAVNKAVVNMFGGELSGVKNGSNGAGVLVKDGSQFNMTGGAITNNHCTNNGGGVFITGAESSVNISGSAVIAGNIADGNGGGVYVASGTLEVAGGVIGSQVMTIADANISNTDFGKPQAGQPVDGNYANNGGGVYVEKGALTVSGGSISGNGAFCDEAKYNNYVDKHDSKTASKDLVELNGNGGGVFVGDNVTFNINGGNISGNTSYARPGIKIRNEYYANIDDGGGGVYTRSNLNMTGGTISNNVAYAGGGGIYVDGPKGQDAVFTMFDGLVDGNVAIKNEGGGIYIGTVKDNKISGGVISNNITKTEFDWGGGGIFVQTSAKLTITNADIKANLAEGFGGGVAGCPSGDIYLLAIQGAAIYDNVAHGENMTQRDSADNKTDDLEAKRNPVFMHDARYQDYFCARTSFVSGLMMADGNGENGLNANWIGTCDYKPVTIQNDAFAMASEMMGLTARPSAEDKAEAAERAQVKIYGNVANTHGGGIMSNGTLFMGLANVNGSYTELDLNVVKKYQTVDGNDLSIEDNAFRFLLLSEKPVRGEGNKLSWNPDTVISEETNDEAGNVHFTLHNYFDEAGKYTLYIVEQPGDNSNVIYDDITMYQVNVTVTKTSEQITLPTLGGQIVTLYKYEVKPEDVVILKDDGAGTNGDVNDIIFVNKLKKEEPKPEYTQLTVKKVWVDEDNKDKQRPAQIEVRLLQDGKELTGDEYLQVLSADNGWTHTWTNLLKSDGKDTTHTYSVKEVNVPDGYTSIIATDGTKVTITNTKQNPGTITIPVSKQFTGRDVQAGDVFTFAIFSSQLNEAKDVPMPGVTQIDLDLNASNTFEFGPISFNKAGAYYYVIKETRPQGEDTVAGVTYDPTLYRVTVDVKDVNGNLEAKVIKLEHRETTHTDWVELKSDEKGIDLTQAEIVFENTYSVTEIDRYFMAKKELANGKLIEGQFTFVLTAEGSRAWGSTGNYTLDRVQPMPADAQTASDGKLYREKTNGEGGFVTFNGIHFAKEAAGSDPKVGMEYHYIIREKQPTVDGTYAGQPLEGAEKNEQGQWVYNNIVYDNSVKNLYVHVYVEDNSQFDENGAQVVEQQIVRAVVHDSDREATFTNTVTPDKPLPQPGSLTVGKQAVGPAPAGAEYTFTVTLTYPDGREETRTLTMPAGETRTINDLPEGTTYTVEEVIPTGVSRIEYNYSDGNNADGASNRGVISAPGEADSVTVTNYYPTPETPTPENPGDDNPGGDEPDLPNPNDPESPDEVTIVDEGVPLTYVKVYEPETEEYVYLPEDEIPLSYMDIPRTGDESGTGWLALLSVLSLLGLAFLIVKKPKHQA